MRSCSEWIKEGAVYRPHWAFEKPVAAARCRQLRRMTDGRRRRSIAFILARMKKEGLHPSPEADKDDADPARDARSDRVAADARGSDRRLKTTIRRRPMNTWWTGCWRGRLMAKQRARYWLDYARYADTYGLHYDNSRDIWPYRDYVIRSFNTQQALRSICHGADCRRPAAGEES